MQSEKDDTTTPTPKKLGGKGWWDTFDEKKPTTTLKLSNEWFRKIATLCVVMLVIGSILYMAARNPGREVVVSAKGSTTYPPSLAALSAGCEGLVKVPEPEVGTNGWVKQRKNPAWLSYPPVNGNYYDQTYLNPDTVITYNAPKDKLPKLGEAVGLLYRGWIVVWYRPTKVRKEEVESFTKAIKQDKELSKQRILVSPWPYANSINWDGEQPWAYTVWGAYQKCSFPSLKVVEQLRQDYPISSAPNPSLPLLEPGPRATRFNKDMYGNS